MVASVFVGVESEVKVGLLIVVFLDSKVPVPRPLPTPPPTPPVPAVVAVVDVMVMFAEGL